MKNADKNRDPEKAIKRATGDLRCAARKLGPTAALEVLAGVIGEAKEDGILTREQLAVIQLGLRIGEDLSCRALDLLEKLTEDELADFETCPTTGEAFPFRLAKTLVIAVASENYLWRQWGAETLLKNTTRAARIDAGRA